MALSRLRPVAAVWRVGLWQTPRGRARLAWHYAPLTLLTVLGTVALSSAIDSPVVVYRLTIATAFASLILFGLSLAMGPVYVLVTGRTPPVSTDLRRDVGVLAAVMAVAHVICAFIESPDWRLYFLFPVDEWQRWGTPIRLDEIGAADYEGLVALLLLVLLLATSADWALRGLGARRWKGLQQAAYLAFLLVVAHGILYQRGEARNSQLVLPFGLIVGLVVLLQLAGFLRRLAQRDPGGRLARLEGAFLARSRRRRSRRDPDIGVASRVRH